MLIKDTSACIKDNFHGPSISSLYRGFTVQQTKLRFNVVFISHWSPHMYDCSVYEVWSKLSPGRSVLLQSSLSAANPVSLLPHLTQTALGVSFQPQFPCLHSQETCAALLAPAKQRLCLLWDLVPCTLKATDALCYLGSWVTGTAEIRQLYYYLEKLGLEKKAIFHIQYWSSYSIREWLSLHAPL